MIYREATIADIPQIQFVRNAVKENVLSDPGIVTDKDCEVYMTEKGKAWVAVIDDKIVGFCYIDLIGSNVWALFILPDFERKGIGKTLHRIMMDWYFGKTDRKIWLGTDPGTRAATFYRMQGWREAGWHGKELKFEMERSDWVK
ncbi:MAG: GNAT family N-acetyltransferase [Ferruginibacter sp.]